MKRKNKDNNYAKERNREINTEKNNESRVQRTQNEGIWLKALVRKLRIVEKVSDKKEGRI